MASKSGPKLVSIDFFGSQEPVSRKKSQPRSNSALEKLAKKAEERDIAAHDTPTTGDSTIKIVQLQNQIPQKFTPSSNQPQPAGKIKYVKAKLGGSLSTPSSETNIEQPTVTLCLSGASIT
jgi:hypothetical protein